MPIRLIIVLFLTALSSNASDLPSHLKVIVNRFNPAIPPDWAYTITTQRGRESSVERFDPSLPVAQQWLLLQRNHRPATADENSRAGSYRIATSTSTRAAFSRGDIDLNSLRLISEDEQHAVIHATFRDDLKDPLLHQLELQLSVSKPHAAIEQFALKLTAPFSPILTVKMLELHVETTLSAPTTDRPALPVLVTSHFRGRVFLFKSIEEDIQTSYSDFVQVRPLIPPAPVTPP